VELINLQKVFIKGTLTKADYFFLYRKLGAGKDTGNKTKDKKFVIVRVLEK
jgi:hypothetical protein